MHRLTHYTAIPKNVKQAVYERDKGQCVLCRKFVTEDCSCCHFIARSQLGMGIEENIVTLCPQCHYRYDHTAGREGIKRILRTYLSGKYPEWDEKNLIYRKDYDR